VFRDVGLPHVLVSDGHLRFTSAFWTALHPALGASIIFGLSHHHTTSSNKAERVDGVIADVLPALRVVGDRAGNWPDLVPLAEFAINDFVSPLGSGYTRYTPTTVSTSVASSPARRTWTPWPPPAPAKLPRT
jgi:hypothetical protein